MTIHRIKLKDLNAQFLKQLKANHQDQEMEVSFWLQPKPSDNKRKQLLSEKQFWQLIALLDWDKIGDSEAVINPLVLRLSTLSKAIIQLFEDKLSEKLYQLDGEKYARHTGSNAYKKEHPFSVDTFLYARCCVVANGREYYETVLEKPEKMPKDLTFSALLRVASKAYFLKTGERFKYQPAYIYETFANAAAWSNHNLMENILKS